MRWYEHDFPEPRREPETRGALRPPPRRPATALATEEEPPSRWNALVAAAREAVRWIRRVVSTLGVPRLWRALRRMVGHPATKTTARPRSLGRP